MEEEETLTLNLTIVIKPEPNLSAADKEAVMRGTVLEHIGTFVGNYDWGLSITGELESTAAETVVIADSQPDYVE